MQVPCFLIQIFDLTAWKIEKELKGCETKAMLTISAPVEDTPIVFSETSEEQLSEVIDSLTDERKDAATWFA